MNKIGEVFIRFFWLIGLIPIYLYYHNLYIYSQNIPHWDDYALINFVNKFNTSNSFFDKIHLVFAQHNEHRIAFTRIVSLLIYAANGSLNFQWMIWVGNMSLIGILAVFYKLLSRNHLSINYLVPICFALFQLSLYEISYWGMASVQNFWVILFALLAFWQISNDKIPYFWAFMAGFTSANGVLFVPIVVIIILALKRDYKLLLNFFGFGLLLSIIYFYSYQKSSNEQALSFNLFNSFKAMFINLGSIIDFNMSDISSQREAFSLLFGISTGVIYLFALAYKYLNINEILFKRSFNFYFLLSLFIFILGTCFVLSLSRIQYGFYVFLTSKYKIYSILFFCSVYSILVFNFKYFGNKIIVFVFTILAIYMYFNSYFFGIGEIKDYYKSEVAAYYNGWHKGKLTAESNSKSCYQYINTFLDEVALDDSSMANQSLGKVRIDSSKISIINSEFLIEENQPQNGAYLEFVSASNKYLFSTNQEILHNKKAYFFKNGNYYSKGFVSEIPLTEFVTDAYFINILNKTGNTLKRIRTNYYIEIEGVSLPKVNQNW